MTYEHRLTQLAADPRLSAATIHSQLVIEGHRVPSLATIGRRLAEHRKPRAASIESKPRVASIETARPSAADELVERIAGEWNAELRERIDGLVAKAAAYPKCPTCGLGVPPKDAP